VIHASHAAIVGRGRGVYGDRRAALRQQPGVVPVPVEPGTVMLMRSRANIG
jgi:hypothetical protein